MMDFERGLGGMMARITELERQVERLRTVAVPRTIYARIYCSTNQSIPTITVTQMPFNAYRFQHGITATSSLIAPETGWYYGAAHVTFAANAAGDRHVYILHQPSGNYIAIAIQQADASGQPTIVDVPFGYQMAVGDSLLVQVYQSSGGALNVLSAAAYTPEFWMAKTG